jgi:ankyrin repeat protein
VDSRDPSGTTALHFAVGYGDVALVKQLLDRGARVDIRGDGSLAMHAAADQPKGEIVRLLVAKGASVDPLNRIGATPLLIAVHHGNVEVVEALLDAGADIQARVAGGDTALHVVAVTDHVLVAELLLERGADMTVIAELGENPYERAVRMGRPAMIAKLKTAAVLDPEDAETP